MSEAMSAMERETVAVLGCGPAGLLAAHACALGEQPFTIFSRPEKSVIGGAQFLHSAIPGVTESDPDAMVNIRSYGTAAMYREKVYGRDPKEWPSFVSFPEDEGEDSQSNFQEAWSMQRAYDKLWETYGPYVNSLALSPQVLDDLLERFKFVVCTIPLHLVCRTAQGLQPGQCTFRSVTVQVVSGGQDYLPDPSIVYDGTEHKPWARASHLFGYSFAEYGAQQTTPPGMSVIRLVKPIANSCTCWDQRNLLRAGRMGAWTKGLLVHDAFNEVLKAL